MRYVGRTFNIPNCATQKIVTGDFGCKGNETAIGVTDGTDSAGLAGISGYGVVAYYNLYNQTTGTTASGTNLATTKALGLTTDSTKSGIITDTSGFTSVNVCIKF